MAAAAESSSAPASASHDSQSLYDQEVKKECRCKLIEHAVRCLTTERDTSACVQRDHVQRVWSQLVETGEVNIFHPQDRANIEKEIKQWEVFHESQIQTRKPSDLRVCYLAGDNPINDLQVLVDNGILCQNVWAIEKDAKTLEVAWGSINRSNLRNVRLFKGDILNFLKDFEGQFDIIYFDACGTLPSAKQNTLKFIGYVFLFNKLTSPGALITNFSFPPKRTAQLTKDARTECEAERRIMRDLSVEYLKYRLVNTRRKNNYPYDNVYPSSALYTELLSTRTDEDIYSDYITYQVIDSAYLFIPAQRMLSSSRSLWDQMFVSKDSFLKVVKEYDKCATLNPTTIEDIIQSSLQSFVDSPSESPASGKSQSTDSESSTTSKSPEEEILHAMEVIRKSTVSDSNLRMIADTMDSRTSTNKLCKAWVSEIFPDWKSSARLKDQKLSSLLLTHLLGSSEDFIFKFGNKALQQICLVPLCIAHFQGGYISTIRLVAGVLYGQMAYPSFPVVNKLLRLSYTAKKRQMFSDVFIFDKCRYVYEQFPSADCSTFAIYEAQQQMVLRMVVDGLRKHLGMICSEDLFQFWPVASINAVTPGRVKFPNSLPEIPERQIVEFILFKEKGKSSVKAEKFDEAIEFYNKCEVLCPQNAIIYANKAHCYLKLKQPENAVYYCDTALNLDPTYVKALFRRALAFKMQKEYSKAVKDLEKVLRICKDCDAERELAECKKLAGI